MKKLYKPFEGHPDYKCIGCSPENPIGFNLEFFEDDNYIVSEWKTLENFQGFKNILHGGIQSTLMDEIASWCVIIKTGLGGVTQELNVKYHRTVYTNGQTIKLRARLLKLEDSIAHIHAELINEAGKLCSEGEFKFFTFPEHISKRKMDFPGKEAYYKPSKYL